MGKVPGPGDVTKVPEESDLMIYHSELSGTNDHDPLKRILTINPA